MRYELDDHEWAAIKPMLPEKLIKIGAKVVCHGRYVIFQMPEVAVPKGIVPGNLAADRRTATKTGPSVAIGGADA
jgi:hypothetical protein